MSALDLTKLATTTIVETNHGTPTPEESKVKEVLAEVKVETAPKTEAKIFKFECKECPSLSVFLAAGETQSSYADFKDGQFETADEEVANLIRKVTAIRIVELA